MRAQPVTGKVNKVKTDALVVFYPEGEDTFPDDIALLDKELNDGISTLVKEGEIKGKSGEITVIHTLGKLPAVRIVVVGTGKKKTVTADRFRSVAGSVCRQLRSKDISNVTINAPAADYYKGITDAEIVQAVTEGALLGTYSFRKYLKNKDKTSTIRTLRIMIRRKAAMSEYVETANVIAEAVNWTRDLVNEPSNYMTPSQLAASARELAETSGLEIKVLERDDMEALGMGGLLGVSQGSQQPPRFIIMKYLGKKADVIDMALVGKGITFDSGGISIKPAENMADMKGDMAGAASVMGTMKAVAALKPAVNIVAIIPATENLPSGSALKPGDIIQAMNGKTMEVLNTDAEGRLILADALSYAVKMDVKKIVDVATLTGACHVALGSICTGAFTNNQPFMNSVLAAAKTAGEYTWQMPMFPEYTELIKSPIADIKNTGGRFAGAITAAKFLEEFVGRTPWVHLDIAGTSDTDKDSGYQVKGATGVPVRTLVGLVLSMKATRRGRKKK